MEFSTQRQSLYWLLGLCLFLFKTECIDAQSKRASRLTNSRSFGTNVKPTSTNGINFDCPEEFGYYPHPTDCTQYYVCVFGGALLESCTGGLMYSHELQTCDWPRNVGCELVDSGTSASSTDVGSAPRNKVQQQQHQQHVPSRIRFGAAFTSPGSTQKAATVPPQYHRSPPQIIQAQVQHIPPPPELRVPPNPIVTSRGQPKTLLESQEEIAKLYTEAEESLPPVEEEESDRQQRVYRGQPSTVSQVQRDRDGIIHQASINAIPNHGKIGSYTFGSAYSESLNNDITIEPELPHNRLDLDRRRKRRSVIGLAITTPAEIQNDSNISSEVMESDSSTNTNLGSDSNNSQEHFDEAAPTINHVQKFSSKYSIKKYDYNQKEIEFGDEDEDADSDYEQLNDDRNDTDIAESKRRPRQLRPFSHASLKWPTNNYRSIDSPSAHQLNTQKNGYTFGHYNPYLTPPNQQTSPNHNYNELSQNLGYKAYPQQQHQHQQQQQQHQQQAPNYPYAQKPTLVYTGYNLSLPPPPIEDDFRPIPGNYYGAASSTSSRPSVGYQEQSQNSDLLPYLIQQLKELKERRKQIQTENFAYFHLDNQPIAPTQLAVHTTTPRTSIEYYSTSKPPQQVTPIGHYAQYSTMGGFYNNNNNNNKAEQAPNHSSYPVKLISQYSIGQGQELQSTTESNYFQYNIIANQKMKGVYNTAKLNQIEHAAVKVRPPVTPLQVTPNFNIVSAPDLSNNKQVNLHPIPFRNISNLPVGITYASNTTLPESYQTFTKSMSSTALPKLESPISLATPKPHLTNFQFNINEFMANLKASDLASLSPAVNPLIKYFKQVSNDGSGNVRNALILRRPVTSTASVTTTRSPQKTRPIVASEPVLATTLATTRIVKGYESFDNSIRMHKSKENVTSTTPLPRLKNSGSRTTTTDTPVEFYDEDYDDGVDEDILPPSQMPPYMPMSETMAPPRPQVTTDRTTTSMPEKQQLQTGFMQATTTRRPFPHFAQHNQPIPGAGVPAFISFPSDIFQELKQRLPQLQGKPSSANQNIRVHLTSTTTTTTTTTPAPAKIRHTVRPQRTRGQQKWQAHIVDTSVVTERSQNQTNQGAANGKASISSGSLGGQHLNSIHSSSNVDRQRDIEYQQQQQPQQQPQQEQPQQYQPTVRQQQQQQQQSTYRPLEILTTSTPTQRPHYSNQPALSYNTDYDDTDVNAQIEQDSVYDHPTRTPQRAEEVTIQTLDGRAIASTTSSPAVTHDARNYYDAFTTENMSYEEPDFSYSSSAEYAHNSQEDYYHSEHDSEATVRQNKPSKSVNTGDYYLIANDVAESTTQFKVGPTKKYTTTPPTPALKSTLKSFPVTSRSTSKTTTITTQTTTKPPVKTTTLQPSSYKTHANKSIKQNVIIKLKTTTPPPPRSTHTPSSTTTTTSTTTSTTMPSPTYSSNPFLKSQLQVLAKSLVSAVSENIENQKSNNTQNTLTQNRPTVPFYQISEKWLLVGDSANSSTRELPETIYDESQNVQVQTAEIPTSRAVETSTSPKFLDFINAAAYGSSNSVRPPTAKPIKPIYSKEATYSSNNFETDEPISVEQNQNKRIQNFVLSDIKPQSFRAIAKSRAESYPGELLDSSSTRRPNNVYQYSLQSGSHGFSLKAEQSLNKENESIYQVDNNERLQKTDTTTTTTPKTTTTTTIPTPTTKHLPPTLAYTNTESYEDIVPTTYAPLRVWRNGRPTIKQALSTKQAIMTTASERELASIITTSIPTKAAIISTSSTERVTSGQSFTARANLFKDNLSRVTSNPSMRFVSPYKSLESLLHDERLPQNSLRATTRSRSGNGSPPFLQTTPKSNKNPLFMSLPQKNSSQTIIATLTTGNARNFSISDAILSTFSPQNPVPTVSTVGREAPIARSTTPTSSINISTITDTVLKSTISTLVTSSPIQVTETPVRPRGRSRYTAATVNYNLDSVDEPTTYAPKFKIPKNSDLRSSAPNPYPRRKVQRSRVANSLRQTQGGPTAKSQEKYESFKATQQAKEVVKNYQAILITSEPTNKPKSNPIENETHYQNSPRAEALIAQRPFEAKHGNDIELSVNTEPSPLNNDISSSTEIVIITDRPPVKFLYSNKYRQQTAERTLAESLQNAGYIKTANGRTKFRTTNVLEQLQQFLAASDSDESGSPQFVDENAAPEVTATIDEIKQINSSEKTSVPMRSTTALPALLHSTTRAPHLTSKPYPSKLFSPSSTMIILSTEPTIRQQSNISTPEVSSAPSTPTTTTTTTTIATSSEPIFAPPTPTTRVSRVNNAIKSSIAAAAAQSSSPGSTSTAYQMPGGRVSKFQYAIAPNNNNNQHQYNNNGAVATAAVSVKCSDSTLSAKCNEIPSRTNNRNRGSTIYTNQDRDAAAPPNRGTHPPRTRPTLKPSGTIVSKAQEFVDIYRYPASRPDPIYPQPTPDKTAAKCRKDVCLLPDCYCGGKDIPGGLNVSVTPQIVLITFDDAINTINIELYQEIFNNKSRKNPNGCPWRGTFYLSHEWTDYGMVQDMYSDGHEMASHTVSHSFGEQFSQKKWTREIAGQREILAAYGGVKLSDVRGMRAPFLSVGGNKMYKMLYDSNFTYDSSMPVYENRPPSWPYTLDYKIFHDCMIPPCPTRSYPGVWQVPMVMWQDLNGGRCSMGDACSNPSDAEGVTKMIMKNFERHYTTNRAPFGLFYHAAWFTQPHHKEGFIKFLDNINAMQDVWIITNWQALQWVRDPTPTSRINSFQPFQCDYSDRPKRCNNPKVCNLWHKSGVRYMKTCQPCPDIYPWTGKSGIRSSRIDNEVEEPQP
ncbi:mucin-5AC isoform X1 [Drosophila albomicans]|uniref:Mucin-5AC isoform X1 n=1 Tax=Drosophila albomicans TaxID=7291 RepID=A0A9C6T3F2_DROAB|nr:mucin-5AC isoform X1 [Drosophila albomicans]XP_051859148.1 mucin-5AC isoform X1 [Drosophila albomicans]